MMNCSRWSISRRTMLRGCGVAMALPLLDVMSGPNAFADEPELPRFKPPRQPVRMMLLNMPCGTYRKEWGTDDVGALTKLKPMLKPLEGHIKKFSILSNLWNEAATADMIAHYANETNLWTSTVVKKTTGADLNVGGTSVDQIAARCTAGITRFPTFTLGMMNPYGGVDSGWARVYNSHLSWSSPTTPVPNEIDPRRAFNRLFRNAEESNGNNRNWISDTDKQSVLDYVRDDANALRRQASVADKRKLDEYLTSVRDVEQQIERELKALAKERRPDPAVKRAAQKIDDYLSKNKKIDHTNRLRLMLEIALLAFWTDSTRVATFMFAHERNDLNYSFIDGVKMGHHESSHWTESKEKLEQYKLINLWHAEQVAYLLDRMSQIEERGKSLLDNSMVLWAGALADGNNHKRENLPILLAGSGGGLIKPGRHITFAPQTPLANCYLTMMQCMGIQADRFADSTGTLNELAG